MVAGGGGYGVNSVGLSSNDSSASAQQQQMSRNRGMPGGGWGSAAAPAGGGFGAGRPGALGGPAAAAAGGAAGSAGGPLGRVGGAATDKRYERGLIEELTAPGGVRMGEWRCLDVSSRRLTSPDSLLFSIALINLYCISPADAAVPDRAKLDSFLQAARTLDPGTVGSLLDERLQLAMPGVCLRSLFTCIRFCVSDEAAEA